MLPDRYNIHNLFRSVRDPKMLLRESYRIYNSVIMKANSYRLKQKYGKGVDVMSEDWDNLILLDACRYDYFFDAYEKSDLEGNLECRVSRASQSWEFMEKNFEERELHDTVYVTANPHVELLSDGIFYTIHPLLDQWNKKLGTVHPEDVVEAALEAHREHPNKRLIIHFMQPHLPFLGSTAQKVRQQVNLKGFNNNEFRDGNEPSGKSWYQFVKANKISPSETSQAYNETIEIALEHITALVGQLGGKTIITSDHGEHLGERIGPLGKRQYGHLGWETDMYTKELREVPWLSIPADQRREIQSDNPIEHDALSDEIRDNRLKALGYL